MLGKKLRNGKRMIIGMERNDSHTLNWVRYRGFPILNESKSSTVISDTHYDFDPHTFSKLLNQALFFF